MIQLNYPLLKAVYEKKGYSFYDNGNYNLNIGFVRESDVFTDQLTDTMFVAYRELGVQRCICFPGTTKAGISPALLNPKVIAGMKGVAVLVPGQYSGAYTFVDSYFGWLKFPYFQQVKPVKVYRDPNGDRLIDKTQVQEGLFGINIHRMSGIGVAGGILGNWSEGCNGASSIDLEKLFPIIRESLKSYPNSFTLTLLELQDFK